MTEEDRQVGGRRAGGRPGGGIRASGEALEERLARAQEIHRLWRAARESGTREAFATAADAVPELCSQLEETLLALAEARAQLQALLDVEDGDGRRLERYRRLLGHEIRNRLQPIELSLLGWSDGEAPDPAVEALHHQLSHLTTVADDVLLLIDPRWELSDSPPRSLREVIAEVMAASQPLARQRQVDIELEGELEEVPVDGRRLELVIVNLVANSLKHADRGKARRWVRIGCLQLDAEGVCQIRVADNGVGIPRDQQERVFEESFRGAGAAADGSGLGLAIARRAVEQMGGRIWLESRVGQGTTVYFTVPHAGPALE